MLFFLSLFLVHNHSTQSLTPVAPPSVRFRKVFVDQTAGYELSVNGLYKFFFFEDRKVGEGCFEFGLREDLFGDFGGFKQILAIFRDAKINQTFFFEEGVNFHDGGDIASEYSAAGNFSEIPK